MYWYSGIENIKMTVKCMVNENHGASSLTSRNKSHYAIIKSMDGVFQIQSKGLGILVKLHSSSGWMKLFRIGINVAYLGAQWYRNCFGRKHR
jgi:hypothetical protein